MITSQELIYVIVIVKEIMSHLLMVMIVLIQIAVETDDSTSGLEHKELGLNPCARRQSHNGIEETEKKRKYINKNAT